MESGSRRGSRLSTLLEDCPRPDLASFQHFSLASDFCRNANAVATLPSLHVPFLPYDPLFNDFIHPFSKNRFERTFGFEHLSVVISHQFLTRVVFFIFSIFIFYKSLYYRRSDEVWLDLDGIPTEMAGKGKKEDTESGSEPRVSRTQLVTPRFRLHRLLSLEDRTPHSGDT